MPKYAALIYSPAESEGTATPEQWQQMFEEYTEFDKKAGAAGVVVGGAGLEDTHTATTIHVTGGKGGDLLTTDGPFAETKEVLGGFYLLECADLDEAIQWASQIPGAWHGKVEIRPLMVFDQ